MQHHVMDLSSSRAEGGEDAGELNIRNVLAVLWRGKWIILTSALALGILAFFAARLQEREFTASASVLIQPDSDRVVDLRSALQNRPLNESAVASEIGVMTSNNVLGQVVHKLDLANDPEFVPSLIPVEERPLLSRLRAAVQGLLSSTENNDPTSSDLTGRPSTAWRTALASLRASIDARQVNTSYVVSVSAESTSPNKAALLANSIVNSYIEITQRDMREVASSAIVWLTSEIGRLEEQVRRSADAVDRYRVEQTLVDDDQVARYASQLESLRRSLQEAQRARALAQTQATADGATPQAQTLAQERVQSLGTREEALQRSVTSATDEFAQVVQTRARFTELQRQAAADQRLYERFLEEMKTVNALQTFQEVDARRISDAYPPLNPSNPSNKLIALMGLVLGGGLGVAIVAAREALRQSFRSRNEVERLTGLPVLAVVPFSGRNSNVADLLRGTKMQPHGELADSMRMLRGPILRRMRQNGDRVIMVTSSSPKEGKSSTTLMLARSLMEANKRTVVVDFDLRRSKVTRSLGLKEENGLRAVLAGEADPLSAVQIDPVFGVHVLPAPAGDRINPDSLESSDVESIIKKLLEAYDLVLLDTPPFGPASDIAMMLPYTDATLYVVNWRRTGQSMVFEGLRHLRRLDSNVIGAVLTMVNTKAEARHRSVPYASYSSYQQ